jgi:hypothetical protein
MRGRVLTLVEDGLTQDVGTAGYGRLLITCRKSGRALVDGWRSGWADSLIGVRGPRGTAGSGGDYGGLLANLP